MSNDQDPSGATVAYYNRSAEAFWEGTRHHDVSQNIDALLRHMHGDGPHRILDMGCGPGRDLARFKQLGHMPVGLDGAIRFVEMARMHSGCEVLHQDFSHLTLPAESFDGIFANASLFHVRRGELPRVIRELWTSLRPGGVLFSSNPRGNNTEQWDGERYGAYLDLPAYQAVLVGAGFVELEHYYRPSGQPRELQPWLASVWRKPNDACAAAT